MSKFKISKDATLETVLGTLNKPENYIVGIFHHMHECKRLHGSSIVRIGVMGEGKAPNYRIEYDDEQDYCPNTVYGALDGKSHKILVEEDVLVDFNWSISLMSYSEVQALLGRIRNFTKTSSDSTK
ncbi:hypothetical protein [Ancylobacter radicis]|uniref:Uncharacterized protein n=1 Tax=Ancylobacter radicis TaxID=2836179 RepID=A0ABS5R704_9HYPH|nr:hypothetical protein [Ancylobacter radicis]MBS9477035.1 hypothetical protein [Ancylobacter radicis]